MPKLIIEIDHEFSAGPMLAHDEKSSQTKALSSKKLKDLLANATQGEFSLSVAFLDPEEGWADVGFEMKKSGLKKGGIFNFDIDEKSGSAKVIVRGIVESAAMRQGVDKYIRAYGKKADLRLMAFNYKGGEWSGFTAPVHGQKEDDFKNWFQITRWSIK